MEGQIRSKINLSIAVPAIATSAIPFGALPERSRRFSPISTRQPLRFGSSDHRAGWQMNRKTDQIRAAWANSDRIGALGIAAREHVVPSILPEPIEAVGAQLGISHRVHDVALA